MRKNRECPCIGLQTCALYHNVRGWQIVEIGHRGRNSARILYLYFTKPMKFQSDIIFIQPNAIYFEASLRCCGNLVSCAICAVLFSMKCEEAITVSRVGDSGFRTGFGLLHWGRLGKCEIDVILLVFFQDFLIETK